MTTDQEIYPMPSFVTLAVSDVARSAAWYQDVLGFHHVATMGPTATPMLVHLRWVKFADLLLVAERSPVTEKKGVACTLCFSMFARGEASVDPLAEKARAAGATILAGPADMPWNAREVTIADPDGFRLNFTAPLRTATGDLKASGESFQDLTNRLMSKSAASP
jgi:catechol 2,3-dioxygenase-like lactoylglutathione lyase family enzyme